VQVCFGSKGLRWLAAHVQHVSTTTRVRGIAGGHMAKAQYQEGDWFAVPLRRGGFAVGIIARANPDGVLLGYFFGPWRAQLPTLDEVAGLHAGEALLVTKFGDLGLIRPTQTNAPWPLIGRLDTWEPSAWPMPVFGRYEELTGRSFEAHYADDDPNRRLREVQVASDRIDGLPRDSLFGAGAVEIWLDHHLHPAERES
jgi:Immunity protein 26